MADVNLNIDITKTIPLSLSLNPISTTVSINPINVNFSIAGGGGGGGGTVTDVSVASPLSNALTFSNPTTIPALNIIAPTNPTTKFLRADGFWVAPSSGSGTVSSISVTVPAGFNVSPASITTSGTFAITYDPAVKIPPLQLGGAGGSATTFLNGLGNWTTPSGTGTVTSVGLSLPSPLLVTASSTPVTGSGTLAATWGTGQIPVANLGSQTAGVGTYLQGNGQWTSLTLPTSWSGTGSATAKLAYALPKVAGTQTGSFQQLAFSDLSGAPFTLTTSGSSGAATFSAGTLNIPQYSGGGGGVTQIVAGTNVTISPSGGTGVVTVNAGGGGGAGTGWTSAATIAIGDIVYGTSPNINVVPGSTQIFDGIVTSGNATVWGVVQGGSGWFTANGATGYFLDNYVWNISGSSLAYSPDGGLSSATIISGQTITPTNCFGNSTFLIASAIFTKTTILTSSNLASGFTAVTVPTTAAFGWGAGAAAGNNTIAKYVIFPASTTGTQNLWSLNGSSWSTANFNFGALASGSITVASDGTNYVAMVRNGYSAYSTNGQSWNNNTNISVNGGVVYYGGGYFLVFEVGSTSNTFYYKNTYNASWSSGTLNGTYYIGGASFANGLFAVTANDSTGQLVILYATPPSSGSPWTWQVASLPASFLNPLVGTPSGIMGGSNGFYSYSLTTIGADYWAPAKSFLYTHDSIAKTIRQASSGTYRLLGSPQDEGAGALWVRTA